MSILSHSPVVVSSDAAFTRQSSRRIVDFLSPAKIVRGATDTILSADEQFVQMRLLAMILHLLWRGKKSMVLDEEKRDRCAHLEITIQRHL